jgi:hypothetical protein
LALKLCGRLHPHETVPEIDSPHHNRGLTVGKSYLLEQHLGIRKWRELLSVEIADARPGIL